MARKARNRPYTPKSEAARQILGQSVNPGGGSAPLPPYHQIIDRGAGLPNEATKPGTGPAQPGLRRQMDVSQNVAAKPLPPNTAVDIENHPSSNDATNATSYEPLPLNPVGTLSAETTQALDAMASEKAVDLASEFIPGQIAANSYYGPLLQNYLRSLPRPTDDVERDFGIDIYEKMMNDPVASAGVQALKVMALSSGVRFVGRVARPTPWDDSPEHAHDYAASEAILAFVQSSMRRLQQPLSAIVMDMLDCLAYGHAIAEMVYAPKQGQIVLRALRVKNRYRYAYVTDRFLSFLGVVPTEKAAGIIPVEWVLPRRKFWHLTAFTHQSDPRGRSLLRAAYHPWYMKQEIWINYLKYLLQFATPSILAILDDLARNVPELDGNGNPLLLPNGRPKEISAEQAVTNILANFSNASAMALRFVKEVKILQADGSGDPYTRALEYCDNQMLMAIIMNPRALSEAKHGSKADSDTANDILSTFVNMIQRQTEECFNRDVTDALVRLNYGDEAVDKYAPLMMLSTNNERDTIKLGMMFAQLGAAGLLDPSQYPAMDALIGIPPRDMDALMARMQSDVANAIQTHQHYAALLHAASAPPDPNLDTATMPLDQGGLD